MKQRQRNLKNEVQYKKLAAKISDDSDEETELFVRNKPKKYDVPVVEKVVEEGDTLQSLSIKHNCSVAILKQLNNIHKENEIFARRTIKVPHRPFSTSLASVHVSGTTSPEENTSLKKPIDSKVLKSMLSFTFLDLPSEDNQTDVNINKIIFNSSVEPNRTCDNSDIDEVVDEEVELLPQRIVSADIPPVISKLSCNGADGDIPWIALIICIVVIIFAIPLIYVFYIAEHPEFYHHHHNTT